MHSVPLSDSITSDPSCTCHRWAWPSTLNDEIPCYPVHGYCLRKYDTLLSNRIRARKHFWFGQLGGQTVGFYYRSQKLEAVISSIITIAFDRACHPACPLHYGEVIMSTMASQITSLTTVYSTVYSGVDQRKHQSDASLALCGEFTGDRRIPRTKGQQRGKRSRLVTSSCSAKTMRVPHDINE